MSEVSWTRERIGALLKVRYGKALPKDQRDDSAPFPVLGSAGRMTGTAEPLAFDPVVVIGRKGNVGQVQLETAGCWPIDTTYYAAIPQRLDERFLTWQLRSLELGKLDSSTATPSLRREDLEAQEVLVPSLEEQRRIVAILEDHLSRLDAADAAIGRSWTRAGRMHESLLSQTVTQARDTANTVVGIGELGRVTSGMTPLKGNRLFYEGGTIPWITSGDLWRGTITEASQFVTQRALAETSLKLLPPGSLLVAMYGEGKTRGASAELAIEATTNQACAGIVLSDDSLRPWVRLVLKANYGALRRLAAGGVQPNLNLSIVKALQVPIPSTAERAAAQERVSESEMIVERLQSELKTAQRRSAALRRSLLAAAFSGRLSGSSPEMSVVEGRIEA